ncbi:Sodium/hydrogen exchanger [Rhizopus microsporus]|uniref:Sodium/hydrogen exchanger n=1 Tax=Rhizopus microsporus TaxID=58291 RepID=A0A1X0RMQ4_RHIZD|nr:Sodium/hydrogen exchanger [Rhizopus microsporus]
MDIDTNISVTAAALGGFILLYGVCSLVIKEKLYISEAFVAVLYGIICGPVGNNWINMDQWASKQDFLRQFTRIVIAIQVMAAGVSLPKAYLRKEAKSLFMLLVPVMIFMWLVSGLCVQYFFPSLKSLLIASCFAPTDPVLANSIVQGHFAETHVPRNIRNLIVAESGANDGLGYPFLFLAIYLLQIPSTSEAIYKWAWGIMGYDIGLSIIIGFVTGYMARKLLRLSEEREWIDKESFLVYTIALTLFLMGSVGLIGSDDLLACFIAGNAFTWDEWFKEETDDAHITEVVDMMSNLSIFVFIGITMPWKLFVKVGITKLLGLAMGVLLFRRLPVVVGLYHYIPGISNWRQAIFMGWFGPIGVGALFYYTIAMEENMNDNVRTLMEPIIYFMILSSVVIHGITIPLFYLGTIASKTITSTLSHTISQNNGKVF